MNIYSESPKDWRDLQNNVAKLLFDLGYETEVEKNIQTVREIINIDVYAVNNNEIPQSKILCECKFWNSSVPKTIIHAFRTTVTDFGANYGIIISKLGFQSGSHEAVKNTNILLLNWNEFQDYFKIRWLKSKQFLVSKETKPLYDYVAIGFRSFFKHQYKKLSESELETFEALTWKYFHVAFNSSNLDYKNFDTNEFDIALFEILFERAKKEFNRNFTSYEEYYNYLIEKSKEGVEEFDNLFNEKLRRKTY